MNLIQTTRDTVLVALDCIIVCRVSHTQRVPVDAVNVAQILVCEDDNVAFADSSQRCQIHALQSSADDANHIAVTKHRNQSTNVMLQT